MKQFEYTVKIYPMEELRKRGVDIDEKNSIVYACRPDGECEVHNVAVEQLDRLSGLLNEMGAAGWELVELVTHQSGIVSFWKRQVSDPQET